MPADLEPENRRRQVHGACFSRVSPTPVPAPELVAWVPEVARLVGLPRMPTEAAELADVFAGNRLLAGMDPYAACYGGHQFGNWAGQLGDGRAITLGEVRREDGRRLELQLKGAGPTPYSRMGDGRAVLRSSIRELLCSESMHHLGVPTTRALSLVRTGESVVRDMFYDGRPQAEPGAVVCRVAPSFLRFGNFEIFASRGDVACLRRLVDYAVQTHFPELGPPGPDAYAAWFLAICRSTAEMIAHWMRVGFVHGVMNTDNMSILGLTIDYGPYGWLDDYDPQWTPNITDAQTRRYRFEQQPAVAAWNLSRFALALEPVLGDLTVFDDGLQAFGEAFEQHSLAMFADKLGLDAAHDGEDPEAPGGLVGLINEGLAVLQAVPTDMTTFWRALADVPVGAQVTDELRVRPLECAYYDAVGVPAATRERTARWLGRLAERVRAQARDPAQRRARMQRASPKYVLRNYLAQLAIDAAQVGDPSLVLELLDVMRDPYGQQPGRERFAEKRPEWARNRAGCSMLSCSS